MALNLIVRGLYVFYPLKNDMELFTKLIPLLFHEGKKRKKNKTIKLIGKT